MGIETNIKKLLTQTAVYWGNPKEDGRGGRTFDPEMEIDCRWVSKINVINDQQGNQIISDAVIYVGRDLDEEGYLYLGTLDSLYDNESSSGVDLNPKDINGAYEIKVFVKSPAIRSTTQFIRVAYLKLK